SSVGGLKQARPLFPVQRQRVGSNLVRPESAMELPSKFLRLLRQLSRAFRKIQSLSYSGCHFFRAVDEGLHLDERYRPMSKAAVCVEYRVIAVLPTLVDEARRGRGT